MKTCMRVLGAGLVLLTLSFSARLSTAQGPDANPILKQGIIKEDGFDVLPRGPIHEAFAQPTSLNPQAAPAVPKAPPAPVPEMPAEQKPEGAGVDWIPGYWAWDSDRSDFIWLSGVYRNLPPGRKWVPGYWTETAQGWRWVAGYYAPQAQAEIPYVPEPPASLENGPSLPAPDDSSFYTPGAWVYNGTEFMWRPGFWSAYRPDMIWMNSCYTWTPGGYVFVNGYWDYPLFNRGLLFAPCYFHRPLWNRAGWFYRPGIVCGLGSLANALFFRPGYPNYYFGNYYGSRFAGLGYRPWYAGRFDPLFNYARWNNRGNPNWYAGLRQTYAAGTGSVPLTPLNQFRAANVRLTNVSPAQLAVQKTNAQQIQQLSQTRNRLEAGLARQSTSQVKTLRFNSTGLSTNPVAPAAYVGKQQAGGTSGKTTPYSSRSFNASTYGQSFRAKQGLVGQAPPSSYRNGSYRVQGPAGGNSIRSATSFQPKSGITGTQRYAQTYSYYPKTNSGSQPSYFYYPKTGQSSGGYRPSTQTYRPSTQTYRPPSTNYYRPSSSSYRSAPSSSRGSSGGGHSSGGSRGGGGGGRGGGGRR